MSLRATSVASGRIAERRASERCSLDALGARADPWYPHRHFRGCGRQASRTGAAVGAEGSWALPARPSLPASPAARQTGTRVRLRFPGTHRDKGGGGGVAVAFSGASPGNRGLWVRW